MNIDDYRWGLQTSMYSFKINTKILHGLRLDFVIRNVVTRLYILLPETNVVDVYSMNAVESFAYIYYISYQYLGNNKTFLTSKMHMSSVSLIN
jgi:hypothetical protein